ncbi:MAG: hypothetical protein IT372_02010 [Polyangiaceae bacterium]|nr:hypothetical protein [Polyangiaceae bacterium]
MRSSIAALLLLFPLALAFAGACTTEEGTTPDCTANVAGDGIHPEDEGCQQFAICDADGDGQSDPAESCCSNMADCELAFCLFGFGKRTAEFETCADRGQGGNGGSGTGGGTGGTGG